MAKVNPAIPTTGPAGFLLWAKRDAPAIYARLVDTVPAVRDFEQTLLDEGMGFDVSALFSSLNAGLSKSFNTIKAVAIKAAPVLTVAIPVAGQIVVAKAQAKLVNAQLQQAAMEQAPLQTAITSQGVPVAVQRGGVAGALGSLNPMVIGVIGAGAVVLYLLTRKR